MVELLEQKQKQKEWYLKNRIRIIENQKAYRKQKMLNDYNFRMKVVEYQANYFQKNKDKKKQGMINKDKKKQRIINTYEINKQKKKDELLKLEPYIKKPVNISKEDVTVIF